MALVNNIMKHGPYGMNDQARWGELPPRSFPQVTPKVEVRKKTPYFALERFIFYTSPS